MNSPHVFGFWLAKLDKTKPDSVSFVIFRQILANENFSVS